MQALQISLTGALLVLGALILIWVLMVLLVRLTQDQQPKPQATATDDGRQRRRQAAAVAVAVALAARPGPLNEFPLPPTALVSAWQAVMRAQQLRQRGPRR